MKTELKTVIEREGQPYVDEPIRANPKAVSEIAASIAKAFDRSLPKSLTIGHQRVRLRWMKPDGHGGLVPR